MGGRKEGRKEKRGTCIWHGLLCKRNGGMDGQKKETDSGTIHNTTHLHVNHRTDSDRAKREREREVEGEDSLFLPSFFSLSLSLSLSLCCLVFLLPSFLASLPPFFTPSVSIAGIPYIFSTCVNYNSATELWNRRG